jgi:phosphoserine phosphatase RsbU/P
VKYTPGEIDAGRTQTLMQLLRELSVATNPGDVMRSFSRHYWALRPIEYMMSLSTKGLPEGSYRITRQIDVAQVLAGNAVVAPTQTWRHRDQIPVHRGGFLWEMIRDKQPVLLDELHVPDDPVLGDALAGMRSAMFLPLFDEGEPRYWNVPFRARPRAFTQQDLENSMMVANLTGSNNTRLLLVEEIRQLNQTLQRQFEEVAQVQRSLLPRKTPDIPGLEIATSYLTSDQAGGDYYDFIPLPGGRWAIIIADVSGHGAAAATVMAMLHGIIHAYNGPLEPDAVVRYANTRLLYAGIEGTFVTALLGVYDPEACTLTYARSGHNPPILKDGRTGAVTFLDGGGGLPLGVFEPYEITSETITLKPNDTLVLYTDGITEAMDSRRDMFGPERLDAALTECSGAPDCVVDSVHSALFKHTGAMTRRDEQTLVAIRFVGPKHRQAS